MEPQYDEVRELDSYLWRYFSGLLNDSEAEFSRLTQSNRENSACSIDDQNEDIRKYVAYEIHLRTKSEHVKRLAPVFASVSEEYRRQIESRIEDLKRELLPARCPECNKILRSAKAKQCLWCGADWH